MPDLDGQEREALTKADEVLGTCRPWTLTAEDRERWNDAQLAIRAALAAREDTERPDELCGNCGHSRRCHKTRTNCIHAHPTEDLEVCGCGLFEAAALSIRCPVCGMAVDNPEHQAWACENLASSVRDPTEQEPER